ncbi:MAG: hypothetical protein AVDCRST_MAG73-386, partial [uncultured Thermomicrobiales bacterium]
VAAARSGGRGRPHPRRETGGCPEGGTLRRRGRPDDHRGGAEGACDHGPPAGSGAGAATGSRYLGRRRCAAGAPARGRPHLPL